MLSPNPLHLHDVHFTAARADAHHLRLLNATIRRHQLF
jgi:hypothetical protein